MHFLQNFTKFFAFKVYTIEKKFDFYIVLVIGRYFLNLNIPGKSFSR